MHTSTAIALFAAAGALAAPVPSYLRLRREVPQEHSHEKYLTAVRASLQLDNPAGIQDPVFALLGNGAAAAGAGSITDLDCLQQATADQAFTNAKAAGDIDGMTSALVYRALERNTLGIGLKSALCTSVTAVNPEIAAITQHQDPASEGAAATNKAITLELAKQIASVGGDPLLALESGTFAPGDLNDNTFAGNTCDDANDPVGCIFTQNLLVEDATAEEIQAAVAGVAAGASADADAGAEAGAGDAVSSEAIQDGAATSAAIENAADVTATATAAESVVETTAAAGAAETTAAADAAETIAAAADAAATCPPAVTVTVTAGAADAGAGAAETAIATATAAESAVEAAPTAVAGAGGAITTIEEAAQLEANVDLGTCSKIALAFAQNLEGRKETSFIPANADEFRQDSAQNPDIVMRFLCDSLINRCGLTNADASVQLCRDTQAAVAATGVRDGSAADQFNAAFGIITNFAPTPVVNNQGVTISPNGAAGGAAAAPATSAAAVETSAAAVATSAAAANATSAAAPAASAAPAAGGAVGEDVQTFTSSLGIDVDPVNNVGGDRPFDVAGSTFINVGAALGRSCDRFKNRCATAANSGAAFLVADCEAEANACRALIA